MHIPAYLKKIVLSAVFILAALSFVRTTLKVVDRSKRLDELKTEVSQLEEERLDLQNELEYKNSEEFIVEEARNELGMVKPREELFVVSEVLGKKSYSDEFTENKPNSSNIRLWLELFL